MNNEEKILMVKLILEDLRGNWGDNPKYRALKAKNLCLELSKDDDRFLNLSDRIDNYITSSYEYGDWDGRYFRSEFPFGYEEMSKLYSITETYQDKSNKFKEYAKCLTYPEYRFDDYE